MQLVIQSNGSVRCVYGEDVELHVLGDHKITRGSHVEPNDDGTYGQRTYRRLMGRFSAHSQAAATLSRQKLLG